MEKMTEFISNEKTGVLKIDRIIFESAYPILFVCSNEEKELFLCVCCQNNRKGKKWLISKTSSETIVKMLKDEIPIRDAFLENRDCKITVDRMNGETNVYFDNDDWLEDSIYLPKKGEYLEAEPDEFSEEIAYYQSRKNISYSERYSNVLSKEGEMQSDPELLTDDFSLIVSDMNAQTINANIMQTLKSFEQIQLRLDMLKEVMLEYAMNLSFEPIQTFALEEVEKESVVLNGNMAMVLFEAA